MEVVSDYLQRFKVALDQITNRHKDAPSRLRAYAELFSLGSKDEMFPLCTALAAELGALPERMRTQTVQFFNIHLAWLEKILDIGGDKNELELTSTPEEAAITLLSALEGGAVVGWALSKPEIVPIGFHAIVKLWSQAE
ncbi:hypothetical protein PQR52_33140 [Paraburkholderia aspalathi]|uniref:hypothetical protein n=1 Tax=Paraburkholderia aspalathi TaxID=1324617 RepID=UPI0038BD06E8